MRHATLLASLLAATCLGCGTTRWSDTQRTATEQLLISDAVDRAVSQIDFGPLSGKRVYLDATALRTATDAAYVASSLRQQMLAQGCTLTEKREEADYVAEARAGAVGTDHIELLVGVPATKLPEGVATGMPAAIPELPIAKRTEQRAVAKIAVFAFNRRTGRPVWQSGVIPVESKVKDLWVMGVGPFQRGTVVADMDGPSKKEPANASKKKDDRDPKVERQLASLRGSAVFPEDKPSVEGIATAAAPPARPVAAKLPPAAPPGPNASPLDEVVPAGYIEPPSVTSGPNFGTQGFWSQPAAPAVPVQSNGFLGQSQPPSQTMSVLPGLLKEKTTN